MQKNKIIQILYYEQCCKDGHGHLSMDYKLRTKNNGSKVFSNNYLNSIALFLNNISSFPNKLKKNTEAGCDVSFQTFHILCLPLTVSMNAALIGIQMTLTKFRRSLCLTLFSDSSV